MYSLYTTSSIYLTSRTSLLSFHDHPSFLITNGRCQPCCSSISCSCCSCCCNCCSSFATNSGPICNTSIGITVPVNPSLLYGLRQSTLIQWPASRRKSILTPAFDRRCYGGPISDLGRNRSSFSEDKGLSKGERKFRRNEELRLDRRRVLKDRYDIVRRRRVGSQEDAESILSLLSEEVGVVAHLDVGEKQRSERDNSSRKEKPSKQRDDKVGDQRSQGRRRKGRESIRDRPAERDSKVEMERVRVSRRYIEEAGHDMSSNERREAVKDEDRRSKKSVSSHSSYCTCSQDGYVSDDVELEVKDEEGSVEYANDSSGKRAGVVISEAKNEGLRSHRVEKDQLLENNRKNNVRVGNAAEWDWRKKSEKKFGEEFAEDTKARNDSVSIADQSTSSMVYAQGSAKASTSRIQPKVAISDVNSIKKSRSQVSQMDGTTYFGSRYRYEISDRGKDKISGSSNQLSDQEENLRSCEYCPTCGQITIDDERRRRCSEPPAKLLYNQEVASGLNSSVDLRESELRMDKREKTSNLCASSLSLSNLERHPDLQLVVSDKHNNAGQRYRQGVSSSDQQTYISHIGNINNETVTSSFETFSEATIKKRYEEENFILLQASIEEVNKQRHHQEQSAINLRQNQMQNRVSDSGENYVDTTSNTRPHLEMQRNSDENSGSIVLSQQATAQQNVAGVSATHQNESRRRAKADLSTFGRDYEQRFQYEKIHLREKVKAIEHHRIKRHELIDERIKQSELRFETPMPIRESSSWKGEVATIKPSSSSQIRVEEVSEGENGRNSQLVRVPSRRATKTNPDHGKFTRYDSGNRPRQVSQASSSGMRVEEIEDEDERDSLMRRSASRLSGERVPGSTFSGQDSGWSSQQSSQTPSSQTEDSEIGEGDYERTLQMKLLPPPQQMVERDPVDVESGNGLTSEDSGASSVGEPCIYIYPEAPLQSEVGGIGTYEEPSDRISGDDVMGSAARMDHMSHQVIEEFVEQAKHEASTSLSQMEGESSLGQTAHEGKEYKQKEENQSGHGSSSLKETESSHHSSGSRYYDKGPTDELWRVTDLSLVETKDKESSDQDRRSTPGNDIVRRSGRSLWNVLGNIVRLHWSNPSESQITHEKSGALLDDSASSEVWFDPESTHESSTRRGTPSISPSAGQSRIMLTPEIASPYLSGLRRSSTSRGVVSRESNVDSTAGELTSEGTPSTDVSLPPVRQLGRSPRRSSIVHEMTAKGKEVIGSGQEEQIEEGLDLRSEGVSFSEANDADMRRRKLLRNKQIAGERFDDWEEAYRRESNQRKVDEIFMREALVEANKAAELWEVPVGAVLVRDGKIIARGHNLVEELRDSTAHAEMICIREGSTALRTWRLAEATLYVTLEPCAMCAGAILQARVGTLVYGAPNKLLGADGSWIRLFPGSTGGEGTLEQAGPVHPFHPNMKIRRGILQEECADAMQQFFRLRRRKGKKTEQTGQHQHSHLKISLHPSRLLQKMQHMFHILFCL